MHSATTATGRPLPPPGKTLPKNRPAPPSCRAARQLAAPKPHVTSELQCYIPALAAIRHSPLITSQCKFNRQPRRLEFTISPTKQTFAPQISRQQMRTLHPAFFAGRATPQITNLPRRQAGHESQTCPAGRRLTSHARSNRHGVRLENAISPRKQTLGTLSNRHFLQVSASRKLRIAEADRPPQAASKSVSNRQWQILEINVNLSKQTIAPRSNRHKNAVIKRQKFHTTTPRQWLCRARLGLGLLRPQFQEEGYGGWGVACVVVVGVGEDFFAAVVVV